MNRRRKIASVGLLTTIIISAVVISVLLSPEYSRLQALHILNINIRGVMSEFHIPGLAACAIKEGVVDWMATYGYADLDQDVLVTTDTLFMLGSVSKIVTGIAFMQLIERNLIDLDDDINAYLPFEVNHSDYPETKITPRMLLSHVSGIHDNWDVLGPLQVNGNDSPISLSVFTRGYLLPNQPYYQSSNYNDAEPGTRFDYTNVGSALIAYLVEVISNMTFEEYCQQNIFTPLGMDETSWFLANLDIDSIAIPYRYTESGFIAQGHYGSPVYPCGFMRTSVLQLAQLLTALMEGGTLGNTTIINTSTLQLMMTHHYPDLASHYGFFFEHYGVLWGHGGSGPGVATRTFFYPEVHEGVIIMLNLEDATALNTIHNHILQCMRTVCGWQT